MRAAAQVGEGALAVRGDGLVFRQLADEFALEGLLLERVPRLELVEHRALERLVLGDDLAHPLLDRLEVFGRERAADLEVVVEAVLDRGTDAELRQREQVLDRLGHHVSGGVSKDVQRLGASVGDYLDRVAIRDGRAHVDLLAVHLAGQRGLGEAGADRLSDIEDRRALRDVLLASIRELDRDLGHGVSPRTKSNRPTFSAGRHKAYHASRIRRCHYCLVLQYGQTAQLSLSALPHSMHGLRSFFMQLGQMRKSFSVGL